MVNVNILERELVQKAREGNLDAFSQLVEAYQVRVVHLANSFTGNLEDARDAAQEAFVKAYENLSSFEEHSQFYTWLYRIVVNTCKDFLRKKKFRGYFPLWLKDEDGGVALSFDLPDKTKNAGEELVNRELGVELKKAMEELPFQQKSVFVLRYLEGLKLEEIAETLGIETGTVKAHLWQATTKMKSMLKYLWEGK